jgi:hypothetical protein
VSSVWGVVKGTVDDRGTHEQRAERGLPLDLGRGGAIGDIVPVIRSE